MLVFVNGAVTMSQAKAAVVDKNTKCYIESQFNSLDWSDEVNGWPGKVQVRSPDTSTNWLSITQSQAEKIKQILLDG